MKDQEAVTTSIKVAESFNKRPDHVLESITKLEKDVPNFGEMFLESTVKDSYGRNRKMFYMNRDGFTLLAMGFTGKKAMKFKLQYIEAFNQLEQQSKQLQQDSYMIADPVQRAQKWIEEEQHRQQLATENEQLKPLAEIGTKLLNSDDVISVNSLVKLLVSNGVNTGRNRFFQYLRDNGYLIKKGEDRNLPTQRSIDLGLFVVVEKPYIHDGETLLGRTSKVTPKGQEYFLTRLVKEVA